MALTQVNSEGIKDGEIKDADVNASAAIAGSKLAAATTSAAGSMSAADKTKLDGVATSATANPSAPALTGSTDNTITTVTGANAIQGEANLTYDGTDLKVTTDANGEGIVMYSSGSTFSKLSGDANRASENQSCLYIEGNWNGTAIGAIDFVAGPDTTNKDDGHIKFQTTTSGSSIAERMRIDSSGRIFAGASTQPSGDNRTLNLCSTSTTEAGLSFSRSSTTMGSGTTSGQSIRLMTDGALTFNVHNVGEKLRLLAGGGLTFNGDTAAANALDDHETGTFTPSFSGGLTGSGYSHQHGQYTKIGRQVSWTIILTISSGNDTTSGSVIDIQGFPFTCLNSSPYQGGGGTVFYQDYFYDSANGFGGIQLDNQTQLRLYKLNNGTYLTGSDVDGDRQIRMYGFYFTN